MIQFNKLIFKILFFSFFAQQSLADQNAFLLNMEKPEMWTSKNFNFDGTYTSCSFDHSTWRQVMNVRGAWINGRMVEDGYLTSSPYALMFYPWEYRFSSRWILNSSDINKPGSITAECEGTGTVSSFTFLQFGHYPGKALCNVTQATGYYKETIGKKIDTIGAVSDLLCKPGHSRFWGTKTLID